MSVYRINGCADSNVWSIGRECVGQVSNRPVLARADLLSDDFFEHQLKIIPDTKPHPRHAVVVDWPELEEGLDAFTMIINVLRSKALLEIAPVKQQQG